MSNNKIKIFAPLLVVVTVLCGLAAYPYIGQTNEKKIITASASYPYFSSIGSLVNNADTIIVGTVDSIEAPDQINVSLEPDRDTNPINNVYTVSNIKVSKVIKGNLKPEDIVKVKQYGGEYSDAIYKLEGIQYLRSGQEGIFFLQSYPFGIPYDTLNPSQSYVLFEDGKINGKQLSNLFEGLTKEQDIINTVETLINIRGTEQVVDSSNSESTTK